MTLQFGPPPARSATGNWLDHGEVAAAAVAEDDAALAAALGRLQEDDAYEVLAYLAPHMPRVAAGLRRLVQDGLSWAKPVLQREAGLALTLARDYATARTVLSTTVELPHADRQDRWRQPMLLGRLQCEQGLLTSCMRSLRKAVQLADTHGADATLARAALAEQLLRHSESIGLYAVTEAVELYRRAVYQRPADISLRSSLAFALNRVGNSSAATWEYNHVLSLSNDTTTSSNDSMDSLQETAAKIASIRQRQLLLALRDQIQLKGQTSVNLVQNLVQNSSADSEKTSTGGRQCSDMDCSLLTNGRATTCAGGYCLCPPPFFGLRCQHTTVRTDTQNKLKGLAGGELSSEHDYLLSPGFQLKQRLAAASVAQAAMRPGHFVLEAGGGYLSGVAPYLPSRPFARTSDAGDENVQGQTHIHHNVEPVAPAASRQLSNGWWSVDLALGFEEYNYWVQPATSAKSRMARSLVVLGFTPTKREYCHAVLSSLRAGIFDRVVLEAPAIGDLLGMSALASSMLELQRAGYAIVEARRLDPCEGWDPLGTVTTTASGNAMEGGRQRRASPRLPPDLHPPDCERFLYVLDRRHRSYSFSDWQHPSPLLSRSRHSGTTEARKSHDAIEFARAAAEVQMSGQETLARAQDAVAFVNFFHGLLARISSSRSASTAAAICACELDSGDKAGISPEVSVVAHIASLLAHSQALQPFTVLPITGKTEVRGPSNNQREHSRPIVGRQLLRTAVQVDEEATSGDTQTNTTEIMVEIRVDGEGVRTYVNDQYLQQDVDTDQQQTSGLRSNGSTGFSAVQMLTAALDAAPAAQASLLFFDDGSGSYSDCDQAISELYDVLEVSQNIQHSHKDTFGSMAVTRVVLEAANVLQQRSPTNGQQYEPEQAGAIAFRSALQLLPRLGFSIEAAAWVEDLACGESRHVLHGGGSTVIPENEAAIGVARERARRGRCFRYIVVMQRRLGDSSSSRARNAKWTQKEGIGMVDQRTMEWIERYESQVGRMQLPTGTCLSRRDPNSE